MFYVFLRFLSHLSPSTRRAWIEISPGRRLAPGDQVALHPEGVDRNFEGDGEPEAEEVALHPEGVDRNLDIVETFDEADGRPPPGGRG